MKDKSNVIGYDADEERTIRNQWNQFSKTLAYKKMMEYAEANGSMLQRQAEESAMPHPNGTGIIPIDDHMAMNLLQNKRGIAIMTTYIRIYSENQ